MKLNQYKYLKLLLLSIGLLLAVNVFGQSPPGTAGPISGPTSISGGITSSAYSTSGASGATHYIWTLTGTGTLSPGSISGSGVSATVSWNTSYSGTAEVNCQPANNFGTGGMSHLSVTVVGLPPVVSGGISPSSQTLNYGATAATISCGAATGGNGTYSYQWQSSPDNSSWSPISGATGLSYSPGALTTTTYYNLISSSAGLTATSASEKITVYPPLVAGSISPLSQTINFGASATALTANPSTGGSGSYTYQWQINTPTISWGNISGATGLTLSPGSLTVSSQYKLITTSNGAIVSSSVIDVDVNAPLTAGTISPAGQTINYNSLPSPLTGSVPTGGNGTYTYQWQSSANGTTYTNISGATGQSYTPGGLLTSTTFHRNVTSNGITDIAVATVTVYPQLVTGSVSGGQTINYNTAPSAISCSAATGGSGSYTYQWQSSPDNSTWTNVSGATSTSYTPGALTATTYYHLVATSNGVSVTSGSVAITVFPQLAAGTISPASQTINYNASPAALTGTAATGGNGTFAYQWQSSTDGTNYTNISGATGQSYSPGALTTTTTFRRNVTSNGITDIAQATVTVYPQLVSGSVSGGQTINYNTAPSAISCSAATGGSGTYTYQWQSSPNNSTWTNVSGATSTSYTPGALTATTYYHLVATSNGVSVTSASITIALYPAVVSGVISPASQTINYGATPATISSSAATGGNGTYTYQWQSSTDNGTWSNISGATSTSYSPGALTSNIYYRVVSSSAGFTANSTSELITVYPQLVAGVLSPLSQTINFGATPATISSSAATGGNGTYTYQWQVSTPSVSFTNIAGATGLTYSPGSLTVNTSYRVVVTSNGVSVNGGSGGVIVNAPLTAGTISPASQTINYNSLPTALTGSLPTGGNGTYTYQWQSSTDGTTYTNISGATGQSYTPGGLLTSTTFHRNVTSNGITDIAVATVTVYPQLVSGTASGSQTINYNTVPAAISGTAATGGSGTYTYQWQSSPNNSTWTNVSGATSTSYTPGALTATTYYHLVSSSNGVSVTSGPVTITVYPQLTAGTISPASQSINYNATAVLTGTAATGGNGTYTYQWQSSPDNSTWTNVGGATGASFTTGALPSITYFRRTATSNGVSITGGSIMVTVYPQLVSGVASPASQSISSNTTPSTISGTAATGGNGTYTYQWQGKVNGASTFTNISGATSLTYSPGLIFLPSAFQLVSSSNGVSVTSNQATVLIYPPVVSGTLSPASQTVNYNTVPATITSTAASGGSGTYSYQWQSSADDVNFTTIIGQFATSYTPPAATLATTVYYRLVTNSNGVSINSAAVSVTTRPQLIAGTLLPNSIFINYNTTVPAPLTCGAATGGGGTYTYQWQSATNIADPFNNVTSGSGGTTLSYTPLALTVTTYYRVVATSGGATALSNTGTVTVYPQLVTGTVSPATQTINYNATAALTGTAATGGNLTYTYQWQSSTSGTAGTFANVTTGSGATTLSYTTAALTTTMWYQLVSTSNGVSINSAAAKVMEYPQVAGGTPTPATQTVNYNATAVLNAPAATGGNGTYTYQWQSSPDNVAWTNVSSGSGATTLSYTTGSITALTYFRVVATSGGASANSLFAAVTVYPQVMPGSITPASQAIFPGDLADTLKSAPATGGNGTYAYQWQSSPDNSNWTSISPYLGGTALFYAPGALSAPMYYRMQVTSNTVIAYSALASVGMTACILLNTMPSQNLAYVITSTPRAAGFTTAASLAGQTVCSLEQTVAYVDGLGRPLQTVQVGGSPDQNDLVQAYSYDRFGRDSVKYEPYSSDTPAPGAYQPGAVSSGSGFTGSALGRFYEGGAQGVVFNPYPYAGTVFDNSPLNRTVEQGAPGASWQLTASGVSGSGHTVKMVYTINNATSFAADSVNGRQAAMYYTVINSDNSQALVSNGYYPAGTLTVTISKDENWVSGRAGTVEEYKNIDGQVVLKRVYNYAGGVVQQLSTYYVYDDLDRLAFVLPPLSGADGAIALTAATLNNLCYQYGYDERGRMVTKQLPGKGVEETVYNVMDQPVAAQDASQRAANQWIYTKYDGTGRAVTTGIWTMAATRASLQATLTATTANLFETATTTGTGYTGVAWPTTLTTPLTVSYFDNYANAVGLPAGYSAPAGVNLSTIGELVATKTAILNTPANMLWTAHYYDYLGRSLKSYAQHYLGAVVNNSNYDAVSTTYDFTNAPTTVTRQHWNTASTTVPKVTISNKYIYDHMGRRLNTWEQIRNGSSAADTIREIASLDYNEIGQVLDKDQHSVDSSDFAQYINYSYNERGWLRTSGAYLFSMTLDYNSGPGPQYNGNISSQLWGTFFNENNRFNYTYDRLNRLVSGISTDGNFIERGISYDVMGNITKLSRVFKGVLIDSLSYNYLSASNATNQLQSITDNSPDLGTIGYKTGTGTYAYDANGNMTTDNSKGIAIAYNLLNLPQTVTGNKTITYTYDAAGNKLRRVSTGTGTTDYINGIQYDQTTGAETLTFIQTEEGRALPDGATGYNYEYNLADNLGNVRISFDTGTGNARLVQQDDYLPFGLEINYTSLNPKNEYLYNGKELQEELTVYDFGHRMYDPVTGRWTTIDPLAEKDRRWSSYSYGHDNPIRNIDVDGMFVKPGDPFKTLEDAAKDFAKIYNVNSIKDNREFATTFYQVGEGKDAYFTYTPPKEGGLAGSNPSDAGSGLSNTDVATGHTHGAYTNGQYDDDHFSPQDVKSTKSDGIPDFVATPNGSLQKVDPQGNITTVPGAKDIPSDQRDPSHLNTIDATKKPSGTDTYTAGDWLKFKILLPIGAGLQAIKN